MHEEILAAEQIDILPLVKKFSNNFTLIARDLDTNSVRNIIRQNHNIEATVNYKDIINMPALSTLAATKAFALGRRAKWKDYVDLYFIFNTISFSEVVEKTKEIFKNEFNEKLFREQISHFEDIDYSESVNFLPEKEVSDDKIKSFLTKISLS